MTLADTMRELADRCEAATGPDRELDKEIQLAIGYTLRLPEGPSRLPNTRRWHGPDGECLQWLEGDRCGLYPTDFTASLDAAMTLVPEGCRWAIWDSGGHAVVTPSDDEVNAEGAQGATLALALTAACLKARAAMAETK